MIARVLALGMSLSLGQVSSATLSVPDPQSIHILSGVPLTSNQDPTGGFGDVAANWLAALEFKRRFPKSTIRFFVLNAKETPGSQAHRTIEILQKIIPQFVPSAKGRTQIHQGVAIIILPYDATEFMDRKYTKETLSYLERLPQADLAVLYSGNKTVFQRLLNALGRTWFSFSELSSFRSEWIHGDPWTHQYDHARHPFVSWGRVFPAGPSDLGIYITPKDRPANTKLVRFFFQSFSKILSGSSLPAIAFAYSKSPTALSNYYRAVSTWANKTNRPTALVLPKGVLGELHSHPTHLQIIEYDHLPFETVKALIQQSNIAPLVTGDNSVSVALSATRSGVFFYDQYSWKGDFVRDLRDMLNKPEATLDVLQPIPDELYFLRAGDFHWTTDEVRRVVELMADESLITKFKGLSKRLKTERNLFDSTLFIYQMQRFFEIEMAENDPWISRHLYQITVQSRSLPNLHQYIRRTLAQQHQEHSNPLDYAAALYVGLRLNNTMPFNQLKSHLLRLVPSPNIDVAYLIAKLALREPKVASALEELGLGVEVRALWTDSLENHSESDSTQSQVQLGSRQGVSRDRAKAQKKTPHHSDCGVAFRH